MLVITRRVGESIIIANDIDVKVLSAKGAQIRLGIKAPLSVLVDREEIHQRKKMCDRVSMEEEIEAI
jgi:carbon storage regulator